MESETRIVERDGRPYELAKVRNDGKVVGLAPTPAYESLNDMLEDITGEKVFTLAIRQLRQDNKNAVRAKFTRDKVSASTVLKEISAGTIKVADIEAEMKKTGLDFTKAAIALLEIGPDAVIDPEKIHWDIIG